MTKCIVLGEEPKEEKLKPIEFIKHLNEGNKFEVGCCSPISWEYIELITKDYLQEGLDVMYAYDDDDRDGVLYVGHWNGGFV